MFGRWPPATASVHLPNRVGVGFHLGNIRDMKNANRGQNKIYSRHPKAVLIAFVVFRSSGRWP